MEASGAPKTAWKPRPSNQHRCEALDESDQNRSPTCSKTSKNEASGLHFDSPNGVKIALGSLGGPLGRQLGSRRLPGRLPKRSRRPPGPKKNSLLSSGGPPQKFPSEISPSSPGERFGLHFGSPSGSFRPSVWRPMLQMRKSQFLQNVYTKTLIFRVPGGSRAPFLEPKTVTERTWKPRARRSQLRDLQNRCPSALGEPPGAKKNFGSFQKRPRGILERFWQKAGPGRRCWRGP